MTTFSLTAPDPPVVKVLKEDCTSISLSLTPPNITGGEMIQKYNIWYTSSGVQPKTRMVSGESFSVTLTGLSPNTAYTIYVNSSNSVITGHAARIDHATAMRGEPHITAQGVYNRLLLVLVVGGACFQRHQLAAVFNASFSVFQMTYEITHINRKGEEGVFCDAMPTYP